MLGIIPLPFGKPQPQSRRARPAPAPRPAGPRPPAPTPWPPPRKSRPRSPSPPLPSRPHPGRKMTPSWGNSAGLWPGGRKPKRVSAARRGRRGAGVRGAGARAGGSAPRVPDEERGAATRARSPGASRRPRRAPGLALAPLVAAPALRSGPRGVGVERPGLGTGRRPLARGPGPGPRGPRARDGRRASGEAVSSPRPESPPSTRPNAGISQVSAETFLGAVTVTFCLSLVFEIRLFAEVEMQRWRVWDLAHPQGPVGLCE